MTWWQQLLISLSGTAIGGVLVALVAVRTAYHRFTREKWWEHRLQVYTQLMSSFHNVKRQCEVKLRIVIDNENYGEPYLEDLAKAADVGRREIRRCGDLGGFALSFPAVVVLREFENEAEVSRHLPERQQWERLHFVAARALRDLQAPALADLGITDRKKDLKHALTGWGPWSAPGPTGATMTKE